MDDVSASSLQERLYWLGFSAFSGIGPTRFKKVLERFGSAKNAWGAPLKDLQTTIGKKFGQDFDSFRKNFSLKEYGQSLLNKKIWVLTLGDKEYPKLLKEIKNPPFLLYGRGDLYLNDLNHFNTIAVVGSRKTSQYGRDVTESLVSSLSQAGFSIVSGLAIGVDAVAHKTALENNAKTIAVLGCGVDCCFPSQNQPLYNSILESGGAIVSELPLSHPPSKGSFPSRNRIIAGLSIGILVTEGAEDSGSLITADYGFKFGRRVFAVPGPINARLSKGPLKLIKKGAKMVSDAQEILSELQIYNAKFPINTNKKVEKKNVSKEEQKILELLENESLGFDEIARRLHMDSAAVGTLLSIMEIKGMVKNVDGAMFAIAP